MMSELGTECERAEFLSMVTKGYGTFEQLVILPSSWAPIIDKRFNSYIQLTLAL